MPQRHAATFRALLVTFAQTAGTAEQVVPLQSCPAEQTFTPQVQAVAFAIEFSVFKQVYEQELVDELHRLLILHTAFPHVQVPEFNTVEVVFAQTAGDAAHVEVPAVQVCPVAQIAVPQPHGADRKSVV